MELAGVFYFKATPRGGGGGFVTAQTRLNYLKQGDEYTRRALAKSFPSRGPSGRIGGGYDEEAWKDTCHETFEEMTSVYDDLIRHCKSTTLISSSTLKMFVKQFLDCINTELCRPNSWNRQQVAALNIHKARLETHLGDFTAARQSVATASSAIDESSLNDTETSEWSMILTDARILVEGMPFLIENTEKKNNNNKDKSDKRSTISKLLCQPHAGVRNDSNYVSRIEPKQKSASGDVTDSEIKHALLLFQPRTDFMAEFGAEAEEGSTLRPSKLLAYQSYLPWPNNILEKKSAPMARTKAACDAVTNAIAAALGAPKEQVAAVVANPDGIKYKFPECYLENATELHGSLRRV
jgi:hypothetical protein